MIKILKFCLVLIILLQGCDDKPVADLPMVYIPKEASEPLLISKLGKIEQKIQLETKDEVLLRVIFDVKFYQERLLISDNRSVLIFDLDGNFIQNLGNQGDGPGEYRSVNSFSLDENTGNIYLSAYNKLIVYDSMYQFLEERKLGYPIGYLRILDGDLWIISEEIGMKIGDELTNQTNIYRLDKVYQITDTIPFRAIIMDQKRIGGYPYRYWLSDVQDELFMFMPVLTPENVMRDTLYQVKDKRVVPAVRFDFERKQSLDERGYQTLLLYNIINSSAYYILEYDQDWERFMFLYDKKNKTGFNLSGGLIDDEGDPVFLRPLDLDQDLFYYIKKTEYVDSSIEEQNPVIGIVKLK